MLPPTDPLSTCPGKPVWSPAEHRGVAFATGLQPWSAVDTCWRGCPSIWKAKKILPPTLSLYPPHCLSPVASAASEQASWRQGLAPRVSSSVTTVVPSYLARWQQDWPRQSASVAMMLVPELQDLPLLELLEHWKQSLPWARDLLGCLMLALAPLAMMMPEAFLTVVGSRWLSPRRADLLAWLRHPARLCWAQA